MGEENARVLPMEVWILRERCRSRVYEALCDRVTGNARGAAGLYSLVSYEDKRRRREMMLLGGMAPMGKNAIGVKGPTGS